MRYAPKPLRSESVPSFPPPPMSATLMREQAKRRPRSRVKALKTTSSKVSPLQQSRRFLLPFILVLSFTVLILGVLYAYCVATPHTMLSDTQLASDDDVEVDDSIFSRRSVVANIARRLITSSDGSTERNQQSGSDNKENLSVALIFYTLSSPLFTILLVSMELVLSLPFSSGSTNTPISSPIEEPRPRSRFSGRLQSRRAHLILLILAFLNIASMTVTGSFWTHCELPIPAITQTLAMCPAEVRGHWMGGIHEVSIAKVTLSWLVVIGLVCHTFFVWRDMKTQRRRWAIGQDDSEIEQGDITVKMEEGDLQRKRRWNSRVRFH